MPKHVTLKTLPGYYRAENRQARSLLFDISKVLLKHKLAISMAKISTNGDFVEDSFHVRNEFGLKIDKDDSMKSIKKEIHVVLEKGLNNAS